MWLVLRHLQHTHVPACLNHGFPYTAKSPESRVVQLDFSAVTITDCCENAVTGYEGGLPGVHGHTEGGTGLGSSCDSCHCGTKGTGLSRRHAQPDQSVARLGHWHAADVAAACLECLGASQDKQTAAAAAAAAGGSLLE